MTHGWKAMNHMIFLTPKREVICCHTAKNNFVITVHWNVGKISDLILSITTDYNFQWGVKPKYNSIIIFEEGDRMKSVSFSFT